MHAFHGHRECLCVTAPSENTHLSWVILRIYSDSFRKKSFSSSFIWISIQLRTQCIRVLKSPVQFNVSCRFADSKTHLKTNSSKRYVISVKQLWWASTNASSIVTTSSHARGNHKALSWKEESSFGLCSHAKVSVSFSDDEIMQVTAYREVLSWMSLK